MGQGPQLKVMRTTSRHDVDGSADLDVMPESIRANFPQPEVPRPPFGGLTQ